MYLQLLLMNGLNWLSICCLLIDASFSTTSLKLIFLLLLFSPHLSLFWRCQAHKSMEVKVPHSSLDFLLLLLPIKLKILWNELSLIDFYLLASNLRLTWDERKREDGKKWASTCQKQSHMPFFLYTLTLTYGIEKNAIFEKLKRHDVIIRSRSK